NSGVSIAAPGLNLRSIGNAGGYERFSGTSFAVPQVAGAAAVLLGIDPTLTWRQITDLMAGTASDRGEAGYDVSYGYGILNLSGCVEALTGEAAAEPKDPSEEDTEPLPSHDPEPVSQPETNTRYPTCSKIHQICRACVRFRLPFFSYHNFSQYIITFVTTLSVNALPQPIFFLQKFFLDISHHNLRDY
ncbi:MAG: S8 family serine peptidase, partial [Alphaproteobacteria bacterium]|nr:S8 family serine peptidase [Alphaproteobacteria bacterium]